MRIASLSIIAGCTVALILAEGCGGSSSTGTTEPVIQKAPTASGDGQSGTEDRPLAAPLRVLVTENGAPRSGEMVTWTATASDGSVTPMSAVTDANGIASADWTLGGVAGSETASASLAGAAGSPVTFTATASPLPLPLIQKAQTGSGDAQTGPVATALANPLKVFVSLSGVAQPGQTVAWATAGAGAAVNPATSVTDASGFATTTWTLGQAAGAQAATATLAGASGSPVTFTATATAGAAAALSLASGDNQTGTPNQALPTPPAVKAADQYGNPVSGVVVGWAVTSGTASVSPTSSTTDATGLAGTVVTLGGTPGPVVVSATSAGLAGSPVSFHATIAVAASTASVQVGDIFFKSVRNGSSNPAVDTVAAGGTVTWTWVGVANHSVQSTGTPSFTSSSIQSAGTYQFTFGTAGTYTYDCAVHGTLMTGVIVVR